MYVDVVCVCNDVVVGFFVFKKKTGYEMRISDWSSDVCYSDLAGRYVPRAAEQCRRWRVWRLREETAAGGRRLSRRSGGPQGESLARLLAPDRIPGAGRRDGGNADADRSDHQGRRPEDEIGRASGRDRVCQYV